MEATPDSLKKCTITCGLFHGFLLKTKTMGLKTTLICVLALMSYLVKGQSVSFSTLDTLGCAPYSVAFQSNVAPSATVLWDFGNGQQSNLHNPTIAFLNPGQYSIKLLVMGPSGPVDSLVRTAYVDVLPAPVADFSIAQSGFCLDNNQIQLNNSSQYATDYFWDFGDGNSATSFGPSHSYTSSGTPTVTLFASNNIGCTSAQSVQIQQAILPTPNLNFLLSTTSLCDTAELLVANYFEAYDSISWNYGDGTSTTSPTHAYSNYGDYYVGFTMLDTSGCYHQSDSVVVSVNNISLNQVLADTNICANNVLNLSVNNPQGINLKWYLNSNLIWVGNNCQVSSQNQGSFPLVLMGSKNGCTDTLSSCTVGIGVAQYLNATISNDSVCKGGSLNMSCSANLTGINWYLDGALVSNNSQTSMTFANSGQSQVYLEAITPGGCVFDTTMFVEVLGEPSVVSFNNNAGCAPLAVDMQASNVNGGSFQWSFNGTLLMGDSINYVFNTPGLHDVDLYTVDGFGCADTVNVNNAIHVYSSQIAHSPIIIEKCAPYELNLTYSSGGNSSWTWNAGNGMPVSSGTNLNVEYTAGGDYLVSLSTLNMQGCSIGIDSFAIVKIKDPVDFVPFHTVDCNANQLILTDTAGFSSIHWSIPMLGLSDSGTHINLPDSINHAIMISLVDTNGCEIVDYFNGGTSVCDTFAYGGAAAGIPATAIPGAPAGFTESTPIDTVYSCLGSSYFYEFTPNPVYSFVALDMGDGSVYYTNSIMHTYQTPGVYMIKLLYDSSGVVDTLYYYNYIAIQSYSPTVDYSISATCDGLAADYEALNSDSTIWSWPGNVSHGNLESRSLLQSNTVYYTHVDMLSETSCHASFEVIHVTNSVELKFFHADTICLGDTLFLHSTVGYPVNNTWHVGSDTAVGAYAYIVPNQSGIIPVWVELDRPGVCSDTILLDSVFVRNAEANWFSQKGVICVGEELQIQAQDTTQLSYVWQIDGMTQTNANQSDWLFSSTVSDTFEISLQVQNEACMSEFKDTIRVQGPTADFQINQQSNCYPTQVDFVNTSVGAISWDWDFGTGSTSQTQNPSYTFQQFPAVPVWLKVTDSLGCMDSVMSHDFEDFQADISIPTAEGCAPLSVQLKSSGTNAVQWNWDLGNGTISTDSIVNYVYADTGAYQVKLITTSQFGCTDTIIVDNAVIVHDVFINPVIQLSSNACAPAQYGFQANSFGANSVQWSFGDGTSSALENTNHFYLNPGSYNVHVEATSAEGCSADLDLPNAVQVIGPTALFTPANPTCLGDSSHFVNLSTDAAVYTWYFGNGTSNNAVNPNVYYGQSGIYDVTLVATDTFGCSQSYTLPNAAEVYSLPQPTFTVIDSIHCEDEPIQFSINSGTYSMTTTTSGNFNSNQTEFYPNNVGWMSFTLVETDANGCSNQFVDSVFIEDIIVPSILPIQSICEDVDSLQLLTDIQGGVWSGIGVDTNGLINPVVLGAGQHQFYYSYGNNCIAQDSIVVTVDEKLNANFLLPNVVCQYDTNVCFQAVHDTGYWYIDGTGHSTHFNPTLFQAGSMTVSHVIFNGACHDSVAHEIQIRPLPEIDLEIDQLELCYGSELDVVGTFSSGFNQYWKAYHKETDTTYLHNQIPVLNLPGSWGIILKLSDNYGCSSMDTLGSVSVLDTIAPSSPEIIRSTVIEDEFTYTEWNNVDDAQKIWGYHIWRTDQNGNEELIDSVDVETSYYTDYNANVHTNHYNYKITSINKCDLKNMPSFGNSILLQGETVEGASNQFRWNPYINWKDGVSHYELQVLTPEGTWETIKVVPGHINVTDY